MIKYPKIRTLFDRRHVAFDTTPGCIEIEIYFEGRRKWISTGIKVCKHQWSGEEITKHPDAFSFNKRLESLKRQITSYIDELVIKGVPFSFENFTEDLFRKKPSMSFRDFVAERLEERKDIREITRKSHKSLIYALDRYKKISTFDQLTLENVRSFDAWLKEQGYAPTTVGKYHKFLKTYINDALGRGLIDKNPYNMFKVSKGKPKGRRYLTEEELQKIKDMDLADPSLCRTRDLFLFQCSTGLAYGDLAEFDFAKVSDHNGRKVLSGVRHKTGENFYIPLSDIALMVLHKYDYKLPIISNQKYNMGLKAIGAVTGKHITSHCGRHTFATIALNRGVPIEVVARMVGHADIKTTQIYAHILDKTVDEAFDLIK